MCVGSTVFGKTRTFGQHRESDNSLFAETVFPYLRSIEIY